MNAKTSWKKRAVSVLLAAIMLLSMAPLSVFAADGSVAEVTIGSTTTPYDDLASAFTAVQYASGSVTVKLLDDVDRFATGFSKADGVQLSNSVDVTLDLNGHYIDRYNNAAGTNANKKAVFYVTGSAKLTVMDSVGGGEILQPLSEPALIVDSGASLTVLSGTISNTGSGCGIRIDGGTLAVEGGTVSASFDAGICVSGGTVTVTGDAKIHSGKSNALLITGESSVTLSGGTYTTNATNKSSIFTNVGKVADLLAEGFRYTDANGLDIAITEDGQGTDSNYVTVSDFGIKYIDADGAEQKCTSFTELTDASTGALTGWHAVTGTVNIEGAIGVTGGGTLNLILCDGATLNLKHTLYMLGGSTLNIYGQSGGTGTLTVKVENSQSAIGLMSGTSANNVTVNIYGGTVTAQAPYGAQPIGINPTIMTGTVNVNIAAGMKCVKTDDLNTAYAYDNTDGTSITITKCTEHKWSYTNITNDTHDRTCDLCGTTETGVAHTTASYKYIRTDIHRLICACGKDYSTEYHTYTYTPNSDGLTHTATCKCEYSVDDIAHTYKGEGEICICGAFHSATYDGKKYASLQSAIDAAAAVGGTVTLAQQVNENVVVTDGTVTVDLSGNRWSGNIDDELIGNIDIKKKYIPLTVDDGSVTLKNGELFQWWSGSSARTGIMINGGSVTVEQDVRVKGGQYYIDVPYPSITLNDGTLILKEGATLLSGLQVPEGKVLANYLPEGTAFVKCSYDNSSNTVTVSDPQEFVPDVYTANKSTESMVIVSHAHDFSNNANTCACGLTCLHDSGNDREASYFEKAICSVCHCEYGDYVQDTTAPTGEILIQGRTWWQTVLNKISFGLFYNENASMIITATDDSYSQPGYDETKHAVKIEYLVSDTILSEEAVKASLEFREYTIPIGFSTERQYVVYVRLTDHAGNIAYAGSDGFEIDKTAPVIENMVDGGHYTYCKETKIKISDKNIKSITLDGREQTLNSDGVLILRAYRDEEQTLIVTDEAGNTTTVYIAGYTEHDFDEETLTCRRCGIDAVAKLTAGDYTAYYATVNAAISNGLLYQRENIVVTLLRSVKYGDPNAAYINLWASSTSFTLDLNGYELGGGDFTISNGNSGTTTIISSKPGGALKMSVTLRSPDATLIMGEGLSETSLSTGFYQYSGTLKIYGGWYYWLHVYSDEKKTELYSGKFEEIKTTTEGVTCADLLAPEYCYEGVSYADAKAAASLESVTVVPCAHASLDENGYCADCGFHLVLSVEKDGVSKNFETFEDAVRYAEQNDGCTVKLLQDITLDEATAGSLMDGYSLVLREGEYTIDLNGKTLNINNNYFNVYFGCKLTISDSVGGGKVTDPGMGHIAVDEFSVLTVTGGEFNPNIQISKQSSLLLKGGSFKNIRAKRSAGCTPFDFIADGYTFANADGSGYASEGKVMYEYGDYFIENVTVVSAPQTIDEQPTDLKFYMTSGTADKYVKFVVSTIEEWQGKRFRITFEKEDGTVINEATATAFEKQEITLSAVNFTASDSGSYRIKLELNGYVLYTNTFNITVTECEHPGYDEENKCTQCHCGLAAAIVKGETTRGYVTFAEALAAAQTDENKNCKLWMLTDVAGKITVSAGDFFICMNGHTAGTLNVTKTAKLNIIDGTITGTVTVAKTASLSASVLNFLGTVNDNGSMGSFINCVFDKALNARGSYTNLNSCTVNGTLTVSGSEVTLNASTVSGKITVNNGGLLRFMGNGCECGEMLVKTGGALEVYSEDHMFSGKLTAESDSTLTLSGGVYTEIAAGSGAKLTISGGKFTNITVNGRHLINCLAEGKALYDMNIGEVIDGRVGIAGNVQVVDHTHTCSWKTETHEKLCGCGYVETVDTEAPVISSIKDGGVYYNLVYFSVTDANDFTVTVDGTPVQIPITGYRLSGDNLTHTITATDVAGNTVTVTVTVYKMYFVTLPRDTTGYTVKGAPAIGHGMDYEFTVKIADGYSKTENYRVLVNGTAIDAVKGDETEDTFLINNVSEELAITVEGVADITAPEVEVSIHGNSFKEFLNRITFGLFFKQTQTVEVKANDFGSGIKKVEYLLSETAFANKEAITGDWTELTLNADRKAYFSIEPNRKAFVYVRVTDQSSNITVVNSDGVVVYTDAEAIAGTKIFIMGLESDIEYYLNMNGNTVSSALNGADELDTADYSVSNNGSFILTNSYLSTLAAGEYTITLLFKPLGENYIDNAGNDAPAEVFLKLTVEKKTPVHDHKESDGKIYDGKSIGMPTFNTDSNGALTVEYKRADEDDTAYTTAAPKSVGNYVIRITTAETDTFKAASSTMEFEIQPREVTISGTAVSNKVYDGTADARITSDGTVDRLVDGDDVTIVSGQAAFADKNVGTDKTVAFTGFSLTGADAANYTLTAQPTSVTADITVKEITINGAAVESTKVYDGTTAAKLTNDGTLSENYDGEALTIEAGSAAYADKSVGRGKTVSFTGFKLAGAAAANYTLVAQPDAVTADITAKEVTIRGTAVEAGKIYDGTTVAKLTNDGTLSENFDGENLTIAAGNAAYDNKSVGVGKTVTFTGFKLAGAAAANYTLIAQPASVAADITVKEIKIVGTAVAASKVYDGNTDAKVTAAGTFDGLVTGDKVTLVTGKAAYDDRNVGNGKAVVFYDFALSGDDAANYTLAAQPADTTASISAKELTIKGLKVKDKQYDGRNTATIDGASALVGVVDGDRLELVAGTPTFDRVTVGKNIPISFTAFTLSGDRETVGNYTLTQPSGITANIVEYVADGSEYGVNANDWINTDFIITAKPGYRLSLTDTADGEWTDTLTASDETGNGKLTFFVKNTATGVISAAVTENYKIDKTAPTGEVKLNERTAFQKLINTITFGLFFKDDVHVQLTAQDEASGVKSVLYYKSDKTLTDDEVRANTDWTDSGDFDIAAKDREKFIIYVRIEDNAGNVGYIGSDGVTFDTTAPGIIGVENGKTYYVTKKVAVGDDNLASVKLNGTPVEQAFSLAGNTDTVYVIRAVDQAGNVTEYTVTMKPIAALTEAIASVTADNVKSSDKAAVEAAEERLAGVETQDATAEEQNALQAAGERCAALKQRIADVAGEITRLTDGVNGYDADKVTSADKADIEKLIGDINTLLDGDNLTDAERAALEALKATARALLERLASAKAATESEEITTVKDITKEDVKLDDKEDLEKAEKALEEALRDFDGNYTEEEREDLEKQLESVKEALGAVGNTEKAAGEIGKLPTVDDVKLGDKDAVERVGKLVEDLTDNEKTMLGQEALDKIGALAEKVAELEKISFAPSIIEGAGQQWNGEGGANARFRSNAVFEEFRRVLVDGRELDSANYIAYAGSTVVELKAAYLNTLSAGEHTLSIVSQNGTAVTTFTVEREAAADSPQTGGAADLLLWMALLFVSGGLLAGTAIADKKKTPMAG